MKPSKVTPHTGKLSSLLMKTSGISDLLGDALSENRGMKDLIMSFINPDLPVPKEVEDVDTESLIAYAESTLSQVEGETKGIENKLAALDSEESKLESNKELAKKLKPLDMDLGLLSDSKYTSTIVGRITAESAQKFKDEYSKITDDLFYELVPDEEKESFIMVVVVANEYKDDIYTLLRKNEFEKFETEGLEGRPDSLISSSESRLQAIESERSQAKAELKVVAEKWDKTYVFEAWVPEKDVEKAQAIIETATEGHAIMEVEEVPDNAEDVPVLQQNNAYAKPYELLVEMYSPLKYNEIDPTLFVALTYPFFFGFCLTDAGYGLLVAIIGFILYRGMGKYFRSGYQWFTWGPMD